MNNNELQHHGVKGMKWGVRRYQNEDGSLTPAGKKRFEKVGNDERLAKRHKKQAMSIIKSKKKDADQYARVFKDESDRAYRKQNIEKGNRKAQLAEAWLNQSKALERKLNDISSDKLKAGRDFIVYDSVNALAIPIPGMGIVGGVSNKSTIIERKNEKPTHTIHVIRM